MYRTCVAMDKHRTKGKVSRRYCFDTIPMCIRNNSFLIASDWVMNERQRIYEKIDHEEYLNPNSHNNSPDTAYI